MRFPPFTQRFGALLIVLAAAPAFATEQGRDTITFGSEQGSMLERPLNDYLRRLPVIPRFDISSTANYKGYTATWEIKDLRHFLATFHAKTNGQPYSVSFLFPGRKLPVHAEWYSGPIHILGGRKSLVPGGYTYERVTELQVTNGAIIATNLMTNVREDNLRR